MDYHSIAEVGRDPALQFPSCIHFLGIECLEKCAMALVAYMYMCIKMHSATSYLQCYGLPEHQMMKWRI